MNGSAASPTAPTSQPSTSATPADLTFCVAETNSRRATIGKANLTQSPALEAFAADGARIDHGTSVPHTHFSSVNGGGVAAAENELHRFLFASFGTVRIAIMQMIAVFWAEGLTGEHYQTIAGPYQQLGCGIYIGADGGITIVQDFR